MSEAAQAEPRGKGRPPGSKNAAKRKDVYIPMDVKSNLWRKNISFQGMKAACIEEIDEEDLKNVNPRDMFRLVAVAACQTRNPMLMLKAAVEWAPYELPKLIATTLDTNKKRDINDYTDEELFALSSAGAGIEGDSTENTSESEISEFCEVYDADISGVAPSSDPVSESGESGVGRDQEVDGNDAAEAREE